MQHTLCALPLTRVQNVHYQTERNRGLKRDDLYIVDSYLTQEGTLSTGRFTTCRHVHDIQNIQTHHVRDICTHESYVVRSVQTRNSSQLR